MKVTAFNGSPHPDGNTAAALREVLRTLGAAGIETELCEVGSLPLRGCTACHGCRSGPCVLDDGLAPLAEKMYASDGVIFGSPVYYAGIAGTMKCFLDRAFYSSHGAMRHKVGAAVAVARRAGTGETLNQLDKYFEISEMFIAGSSYWNMVFGRRPGDAAHDKEGLQTMRTLADNMIYLLQTRREDLLPARREKKMTDFIRL